MAPQQQLRVAHVLQNFAIGGLERMVQCLAEQARPLGIESWVAAYKGQVGSFRDELTASGIHTALLPTPEGLQPGLIWRLARWLREHGIDVVHSHNLGPCLYAGAAAKLAGARHVYTEHSREHYKRPQRRVLGFWVDRIAEVVAVSEEGANFRAGAFFRRCRVIDNGVRVPPVPDPQRRQRARQTLGVDDHRFVVGCVARLSPEKNHEDLIRAFAMLKKRLASAALVLIGDGARRAAIEQRVREADLGDHVLLLGNRGDVSSLLPGLDVVALASHREGQPLALLEAMASGVPVVATAVGGIPGLLSEGGGRTVHPGDPRAMANALWTYATDDSLRARDATRAREVVVGRYGSDRMVEKYVQLYRSLIGRTGVAAVPQGVAGVRGTAR